MKKFFDSLNCRSYFFFLSKSRLSPPLVGPIENLDEQVSRVIRYGPQPKEDKLANVHRCLSILDTQLRSERDYPVKSGWKRPS